jgi:hypothetical protein
MQENLFEQLSISRRRKLEIVSPQIELDLDSFKPLENIYLLHAYYYKHQSKVIQKSPKLSTICQFHYNLVTVVSQA